MKKLFALFMVVAMLSVASTAMATSISASKTDVELARGSNTTVTVTGTASHGGTLEYSLVYGLGMTSEWASISGTTVTLTAPSAAEKGAYTVVVRATESYTEMDDATGHVAAKTDTADVQITVNVLVPVTPNQGGGSSAANSKTETIVVLIVKTVSNVRAPKAENVITFTIAQMTAASSNNSNVVAQAISFASRLSGSSAPAEVLAKDDADAIEFTASATGQDHEDEQAAVLANNGATENTRKGPNVPGMTAKKSGLAPFDLTYGAEFHGGKPGWFSNAKRGVINGEFSASAVANDAIFLDSTGAETEVIPGSGYGNEGAEPGMVTAVVYVEEGVTYEPITYAEIPAERLAAFDTAQGTETKDVELETTVEVTVTVNSTATFSPVVSDARVIEAVSNDYGKPVKELPYTTASTTATWSAEDTEDAAYMEANNLVYVSSLPVLENIPDGTYIAAITFDNTPTLEVVGAPKFYPNGVVEGGAATSAKLYTYANGSATEITASNAKDVVVNGRAVYLVFEVAGGAVATADFDAAAVTLTAPSIVVSNTDSSVTPVVDAKVQELIAAGYVTADGTALKEAAFASTPVINQSDDIATATVTLNFPVASWYLYVAGSRVATADFEASATGSITKNGDSAATMRVDRTTIARGTTASVSFGVIPEGSAITTPITYTLGNVTGAGSDVYGVGSSSGGCSAASAVLALAVLGSFVLTRKK